MNKNLLLSGVASLALSMSACSSEPSSFRPDKQVSVDQVAPGSRSSDNFDQGTAYETNQAKGAAIPKPVSSAVEGVDGKPKPSAEASISANAEEAMRTNRKEEAAKINAKPSQADTMANGSEIQR
ncbi:hypothetical protein [Hymenobacter sp. HDW8]|uniref:hypothetical protein n=1 Tax=Hymenobacter sp. HDW8 TaxID=2714932 RepID=UPI00140B5835|nr:hypothetical protein [Hymenobacter sp. HDW8]QIL76589.1 hypothetical protein G7064_12515 [Hymenobacter sp. HDW8]